MTTDDGGESPDPYDEVADRPPPKHMGPADSSTSVAGSLEYASPELLESSNGVIHPSVDIWAFGVIVYTVIVGSRPFQDSFAPRIQSNILSGTWNREAILSGSTDDLQHKDRQDALDLVIGCLEMDVNKRWTIRDILACPWLRDVTDSAEESSPDSVWKL
jgi:serine/threonine protein kinase